MALKTLALFAALAALAAGGAQAVGVSTQTGADGDPASLLPDADGVHAAATATAGTAQVEGATLRPRLVTTAAAATPPADQWRAN